MIIIGDVHGKVHAYHRLVRLLKQPTIQVGDFGFKASHEWHRSHMDPEQHKVLFGNHDYYPMLNEPHSLGDYAFLDGGIMAIRGAKTFDKMCATWVWHETGEHTKEEKFEVVPRHEGVDLFEWQEELDYDKCGEVIDKFQEHRPSIVISHDCPAMVRQEMMKDSNGEVRKSRTDHMLQNCFEKHQPDLWIYGHYHRFFDRRIEGTRFVCLEELQIMEI